MDVIVINPPLVQLNTVYPAGAYLSAYFRQQDCNVSWHDLSIRLFYSIFSRKGLTKLFELSSENALVLADNALSNGDEATAFNLRRYVATKQSWINWIDFITESLRGVGQEKAHQFLYSPYAPRGSRMENYLAGISAQNREPNVDDIRFLCTFALADLADYITAAFDSNFSLIRYAEALTVNESSFAQIEKQIESPVMEYFYKPVLDELFDDKGDRPLGKDNGDRPLTLICISIPFAGTFTPALYTAAYLKKRFGQKVYIAIGGGFVNTELRQVTDKGIAKYIDAISYDRGYGSYKELLSILSDRGDRPLENDSGDRPLYKLCRFIKDSNGSCTKIIEPLWQNKEVQLYEDKITTTLVPDYSDIDFSVYPRTVDDLNPMHRLWVDGAWIKAYLAHGCYWHKCAFCDTQLDYVCAYKQTEIEPIFYGLLKTCQQKGLYGIHFVDEALPPSALKKFALLNVKNGNQLYYWGNIRFEKSFTYDLSAFLSYCGFGGASAGIEAATNNGLQTINKGTDIHNIVKAACGFKENGILVHAYMIYGFWNDTPQSIIDSLETLRQLFAEGLLDSAFWHKFVLTKNSQVFAEYEQGKHPDLKPILKNQQAMFAKNNLHFEGENKFNKFGNGLDSAVNSWMKGEKLEMKVSKWFDFQVPEPTISKNFIAKEIEKYERAKEEAANTLTFSDGLYWLGSEPVVSGNTVSWFYLQEEMAMEVENAKVAKEIAELLSQLKPEVEGDRPAALEKIRTSKPMQKKIRQLHASGIVEV